MKLRLIVILSLLTLCLGAQKLSAQIITIPDENVNTDSLRRAFDDRHYYFGIYKDNYITFGIPIGQKFTTYNCNTKFQISFAQKLTKNTLPWGTYLYLFYTQKVLWDILRNSQPMTDLNFNPGFGLTKPLFVKNRFIGKITFMFEHESNGRDGDASRSWERFSLAGNIMVDPNFVVHAKFWIPIVDSDHNRDLLKYAGLCQFGFSLRSHNQKWQVNLTLVKRQGWNFNFNTTAEVSYRISKNDNEYLFAQYYNGYAEGMLEYKKFVSALRFGIVIKPNLFSEF